MAALLAGFLWGRPWWFGTHLGASRVATPSLISRDTLWIHYHERVPYYITSPTGVTGLCAEPVRRALERSGLPHRWRLTPPRRQLLWLRTRTREAHAAVGWFRTPERETWGRFSIPIHRDGPTVAIVRQGDARIPPETTAVALLSRHDLLLLTKAGYAYGPWLDPLLERHAPPRMVSAGDVPVLLRMIVHGRADYLFMAREEAEALLAGSDPLLAELRTVLLRDAPPGPTRHVLFGAGVPDAWIARLDEALREITVAVAAPSPEGWLTTFRSVHEANP